MSGFDTFWQVIKTFLGLSLFSLGGGNTLLQEYHHLLVDTYYWISNIQFADLYALAEVAPGPSSIIVGLTVLRTADHHWPAYLVSFIVCGFMLSSANLAKLAQQI
jgi:chromate transporter